MRIAVLLHYLTVAGGLSVGKNLAKYLPALGRKHDYFLTIPAGLGYEQIVNGQTNVQYQIIHIPNIIKRRMFDRFSLPKIIDAFKPDLLFGAGNLGLYKPKCPQVILFQRPQLIYPIRYARTGWIETIRNLILKRVFADSLIETDRVFCQTPVAQKRLSEAFHYPLDKIGIMPNAVSAFSKAMAVETKIPEVFREKKSFDLFFLTKYYTHKNLEILIPVFRDFRGIMKDVRCIITIASNQHPRAKVLLRAIEKYSLQENIVNVGQLEQSELEGYYRCSDALFFPTLLESFSGTYLEAMYFNCPILTSDIDFAHYICDDAAVYFNPWVATDIVDKIKLIRENEKYRKALVDKGKKRVAGFFQSWEEIVRDFLIEIEQRYSGK